MTNNDKPRFLRSFAANAAVFNRAVTDDVVNIYWVILADYTIDEVESAFVKSLKTSKFFPTPAEIIGLIPSAIADRHVGADEAWGLVLESFDEFSTVVMTREISEARGLVLDIYESGDVTGARMAFREAYNRIISSAGKPQWFVSEGFDAARKADAVRKAIQIGRLPAGSEAKYLLEAPNTTVTGLIESANEKAQNSSDAEFRKSALRNIGALKAMLGNVDDDGVQRREIERKAFEKHRDQELARLAQKAGEMH